MSVRPATLCKLEKGKLIDSNTGFVDTYNWMVDYINNLRGDDNNIELDDSTSDHPIIKYTGGDKAEPSVVRGDADATGKAEDSQKSVTVQSLSSDLSSTEKVVQLYGFANAMPVQHTISKENPSLTSDGADAYTFLLRKQGTGNEIEYANITWELSSELPPLKITVDGETTTYDGTEEKEIEIDTGGSVDIKTLTIQTNGTTIASYDGTADITANIQLSSGGGSAITVEGTDGSSAVCNDGITFASENDSNVTATVTQNGTGVKVTIGVYYL